MASKKPNRSSTSKQSRKRAPESKLVRDTRAQIAKEKAWRKARAEREKAQRKASDQRIRELNQKLKTLQKLGLYTPKPQPIGAVRKGIASGGKRALREFRDVLLGNARVLRVNKTEAKAFKKHGERVRGEKIVLPKTENVDYTSRRGKIVQREKVGNRVIEKEIHPMEHRDVLAYLEAERKNPKFKGKKVGFKIRNQYGVFYSHNNFQTINDAIRKLREYAGEEFGFDEIIERVEFITLTNHQSQVANRDRDQRTERRRKAWWRRHGISRHARLKKVAPKKYELFLENERARQARFRNSKKTGKRRRRKK